ncbi:MAG: UDP-N-acetylglucosamine--LPS N-acetylglucosamine transferase [Planctomycetes bacterium]|nr:UDP-N-acetylglucosamine--LPS N-acetylglucosamine transferase [Planctomycetota bacterium]
MELLRLAPAFTDCDMAYVTVVSDYRDQIPSSARFHTVVDVTRWNKLKWLLCAAQLARIIAKERPAFVITTGAMPGYLACRIAKVLGAKVAWLDSIANVEELSRSGQLAGRFVDLWLTQWPHLADSNGPEYRGAVL